MTEPDLTTDAMQTYLYGYPLVYNLMESAKLFDGTGHLVEDSAPNRFGRARRLAGPDAAFVSPNNDTLYLIAGCDLRDGPLVLEVPDTHDRYYVLQFVDAWTNNFAYIGRRATGTAAQTFLLAPTGYAGPVPDGATVVDVPSRVFVIVGRLQVNGVDDLPAAHALQDQFVLTSLDPGTPSPDLGTPAPDPAVAVELSWWEEFRVALAAYPPGPADAEFVATAARLGLTGGSAALVEASDELRAALVEGQRRGEEMVDQLGRTSLEIVAGWSTGMHVFDYNTDHLGLGTIDAPEWRIADRTRANITRAVAARLGLWGNHGYEARYDVLWQDENDERLNGAHAYELTLSPPPSVDAFWSLTMYDEPRYYLVANEIDRYSIGDRTPGVSYDEDGSITILMQRARPESGHVANWLPAPEGPFRPVLRSYQPVGPMVTGEYVLPTVRRLDTSR